MQHYDYIQLFENRSICQLFEFQAICKEALKCSCCLQISINGFMLYHENRSLEWFRHLTA